MEQETLKRGRYRVVYRIGRGPISEVYLVEDRQAGEQVALKLIRLNEVQSVSQRRDALFFFDYKVKMLAGLSHDNILPVLDYGEEYINGTPIPYIVMPYCPQGTLADWLQARENYSTLSLQDVARIVHVAANALQYAHEQGILHQHVKPSNFHMCGGAGFQNLMLSDFHVTALRLEALEAGPCVIGSPVYLAPEQWKDAPVPASDQYALAVMTYHILTGHPPFRGNAVELMHEHIHTLPASPGAINPLLSQGIDAVLLRALEKEPGKRFTTISDFASAFEQVIRPMAAPAMVMPATLDMKPNTLFNK